jgi:hypothetical protein
VDELISCQPTPVDGKTGDFEFSYPDRSITSSNAI